MHKTHLEIPNYRFESTLGSGSFGTVFKAIDLNNNQLVAIKRSLKSGSLVSREYIILKEISDCNYCIKLLDIFYTLNEDNLCIQNLVFEFIPDNLSRFIKFRYKSLSPFMYREIVMIMRQILLGLKDIHYKKIIHRDLKPENILINPDTFELKICDFGSAKRILNEKNTPYIVSRYYRAPELIFCNNKYNSAIDIWSAGCIFIELFTGVPPFIGKSEGEQFIKQAIVLGPPTNEELNKLAQNNNLRNNIILKKALFIQRKGNFAEYFRNCSHAAHAADLAQHMLNYDPDKRLTAEQCLEHQFFTEF